MLLRPFSDLHVEFWKNEWVEDVIDAVVPPLETDAETVAVVAGDVGLAHLPETWVDVLDWLSRRFRAVVYVEGNHFFYHNDLFGRIGEIKRDVVLPENVHFLENNAVTVGGVLFVGATLWTDFCGRDRSRMMQAMRSMNDFRLIAKLDGYPILPLDTVCAFDESRRFIFDALRKETAKRKVVVTHHGVSPRSIPERFRGDGLNCAFMTDLSEEILDSGPELWVHGHVHDSFDYTLGRTRVVVNPFGYRGREENPSFDRTLVIEI